MTFSSEIQDYAGSCIPANIRQLISQAMYDLYYGPVVDDEEYPGFETACVAISDALDDLGEIWIDTFAGGYITSEPQGYEDLDGEWVQPDMIDYRYFDVQDLKREILGELAPYVN